MSYSIVHEVLLATIAPRMSSREKKTKPCGLSKCKLEYGRSFLLDGIRGHDPWGNALTLKYFPQSLPQCYCCGAVLASPNGWLICSCSPVSQLGEGTCNAFVSLRGSLGGLNSNIPLCQSHNCAIFNRPLIFTDPDLSA